MIRNTLCRPVYHMRQHPDIWWSLHYPAAQSIRELIFASIYNYSQNICFAIWHSILIMFHFLFELKDFKLFSSNTYYFYKTLFCHELLIIVSIPFHFTDSGALYLPFIETHTQALAVLSSFHALLSVCVSTILGLSILNFYLHHTSNEHQQMMVGV